MEVLCDRGSAAPDTAPNPAMQTRIVKADAATNPSSTATPGK